jgi:hypothetical protein
MGIMAHGIRGLGLVVSALAVTMMGACGGSSGGGPNTGGGGGGGGGGTPGGGGSIGNCTVFPTDNAWNLDVSNAAVDPNSDKYMAHMNAGTKKLHPDFGSDPSYGIPYIVVPGSQPKVPITFQYADESDPGPYPIPDNVPIEQGDAHALVIDKDNCLLYETYNTAKAGSGWSADSGALFDLKSNKLRPDNWTSADAAGLPIFAGLARVDEVKTGEIRHALRFTANSTQNGYVHPATHAAGSASTDAPPMGLRVRLKASYDISAAKGQSKVILTALKKYGMFLADNGSDWYISGATDPTWDDDDLNQIKATPASAFEVVQLGTIQKQQ